MRASISCTVIKLPPSQEKHVTFLCPKSAQQKIIFRNRCCHAVARIRHLRNHQEEPGGHRIRLGVGHSLPVAADCNLQGRGCLDHSHYAVEVVHRRNWAAGVLNIHLVAVVHRGIVVQKIGFQAGCKNQTVVQSSEVLVRCESRNSDQVGHGLTVPGTGMSLVARSQRGSRNLDQIGRGSTVLEAGRNWVVQSQCMYRWSLLLKNSRSRQSYCLACYHP